MLSLSDITISTLFGLVTEQHQQLSSGLMLFAVALGLILAIAFQAVLASLGAAVGLTLAHPLLAPNKPQEKDAKQVSEQAAPSEQSAAETLEEKPQPLDESENLRSNPGQLLSAVGVVAGLSLLLTVDAILFGACFLAVRFSQLVQPLSGITLGLVIWALYLLSLLTLGSSALGATAEFLLGGTLSNLRRLLSLIQQVLHPPTKSEPSSEQEQLFSQLQAQLAVLQGELAMLSTSIPPMGSSVSTTEPTAAPQSNRAGELAVIATPHSPSDSRQSSTAPPSELDSQPDLKAAAVALASTAASSMTSAARTTVSDSLRQVQAQVQNQVDATATSLLSELNQGVQTHAKQALEQVDISDWSLEQLWTWAGKYKDSIASAVATPETANHKSYQATAESNAPQTNNAHFSQPDRSSSSPTVPPAEIAQINLDFRNYLKYTSLKKLSLTTLEQKLDELLGLPSEITAPGQEKASPASQLTGQFDLAGWKQALLSRKGMKPARLRQYMTAIKAKVLCVAEPAEPAEPTGPSNLEKLTEQAQTLFAKLDNSLQQGIDASTDLLPSAADSLQTLRDRLPSLSQNLTTQLADLPDHTSEQLQAWATQTQTHLEEQVHQAQTALEESLETVKIQALQQAEQIRHWAAIAAWWLLGLMLSSAIAAATAGYYAVSSPWLRSL